VRDAAQAWPQQRLRRFLLLARDRVWRPRQRPRFSPPAPRWHRLFLDALLAGAFQSPSVEGSSSASIEAMIAW